MKISSSTIKASDVLSIEELPTGRAGVSYLNWEVSPLPSSKRGLANEAFFGAGIYALCLDHDLIYIGSYLGSGNLGAAFNGDVVRDRWWTHIASITGRGSRVHFAPATTKFLRETLEPEHPILKGLNGAKGISELHKDVGNLAPLRRVLFAAKAFKEIFDGNVNVDEILGRFNFIYVRFEDYPLGVDAFSLMRVIESVEKSLVSSLCPPCNSKWVPKDGEEVKTNMDKIEALVRDGLLQRCNELLTPDIVVNDFEKMDDVESENLSNLSDLPNVEKFWESIPPDSHYARIVIDALTGIASRCGLEPTYTATNGGDFRLKIQPLNGGILRVVLRIFWQPNYERFFMSIYAPDVTINEIDNLVTLSGADEVSLGSPGKVVLKFRPKCADLEFILSMVLRAIRMGRINL
jgi:hypothetical protein